MAEELKKNMHLTVTVEGYSSEGLGVARHEGRVLFVHGAVRGETCEVLIMKVLKNAAFAKVVRVLEPAPGRVEADCPYYPACGGCQVRHLSYEEELKFKKQKVQDALRRIGGAEIEVERIYGAARTERCRNKVQFPVAPGKLGPKIGFYRSGSHDVVDVKDCLLQSAAAARIRAAVLKWMCRRGVQPCDEKGRKGLVRHVYVRTNEAGQSLCCIVVNAYIDQPLPCEAELLSFLREAEPGLVGVVLSAN